MKPASNLNTCLSRIALMFAASILASQTSRLCFAQHFELAEQYKAQEVLDSNARLSIVSSNMVMLVGSTNLIHCRIENRSTNEIVSYNTTSQSLQYLPDKPETTTNGDYIIYGWTGLPQPVRAHENHLLESGQAYDWDEQVVIGDGIKPGYYAFNLCDDVQMTILTNYWLFNHSSDCTLHTIQVLKIVKQSEK